MSLASICATPLCYIKRAWHDKGLIIASLLFILSPNWLSDALKGDDALLVHTLGEIAPVLGTNRLYAVVLSFLILVGSAIALYNILPKKAPIRSLSPAKKPYPRRVLIISVSTPTLSFQFKTNPPCLHFTNAPEGCPRTLALTGNLNEDIELFNTRNNTQHILRALKIHHENIEHIMLIGSSQLTPQGNASVETGSQPHLAAIGELLKFYCTQPVTLHTTPQGINFENVDALYKTFCKFIDKGRAHNCTEPEMIIDATGGQKTASIAASLATLHNRVAFQYVQNSHPFAVKSYDLMINQHPHFDA